MEWLAIRVREIKTKKSVKRLKRFYTHEEAKKYIIDLLIEIKETEYISIIFASDRYQKGYAKVYSNETEEELSYLVRIIKEWYEE